MVLMGFKESYFALATDQIRTAASFRPPPDPDSPVKSSTKISLRLPRFKPYLPLWLTILASNTCPTLALPSLGASSAPNAYTISWCISRWWSSVQPLVSSWIAPHIAMMDYALHTYWSMIFVWCSFAAVCFAVSRLQRTLLLAVRYPKLHFGPFHGVCGYALVWWLTQYMSLLGDVPYPQLWWFFTLQTVPVYCILLRGMINAAAFWLEWTLSSLMVSSRCVEPAPFFCGYTGSWFVPPRRRRRRGESPIRMPRLVFAEAVPSVCTGVLSCYAYVIFAAFSVGSTFLSCQSERLQESLQSILAQLALFRQSEQFQELLDKLAWLWIHFRLYAYHTTSAAYLLWALLVILDLLVPPWYTCVLVSFCYCALNYLLRLPPTVWHIKDKYNPDGTFNRTATRLCFLAPCGIAPSRPELLPPSPTHRPYLEAIDPLAWHAPLSPGLDPHVDMEARFNNDYFWWSEGFEELDDLSDEILFGWMKQDSLFSLADAGYRFTISVTTTTIPLPRLSWRERHTTARRAFKASSPKTLPVPPLPPPTEPSLTTSFLRAFNPAESARQFLPKPHPQKKLFLSIDLSKYQVKHSLARVFLNYVFNVALPEHPLIVDSGASVCITPYASDFKPGSYKPSSVQVKDLSGITSAAGEGILQWPVVDEAGVVRLIEVPGVHLETSTVRLLSPQVLLQSSNATLSMNGSAVCFKLGDSTIRAPIDKRTNLPQLHLSTSPSPTPSTFGFDTFGFEAELTSDWDASIQEYTAYMNILRSDNTNLRASQKELLLWHQRLSHYNLPAIRSLMLPKSRLPTDDPIHPALHEGPILPIKLDATARVDTSCVKCGPCLMAKARRRTTGSKTPRSDRLPGSTLRRNDLTPGKCVSCDHFVCSDRGRRLDTFGRNTGTRGYVGGALYVDHASGKIFHYSQTDLSAEQTIRGKQTVEKAAADAGFDIKAYHSDNGVFASAEFRAHCNAQKQDLSFSGANAHHQNAIAERGIGTVSQCARANLIHVMLCWPERAHINLWAFAINYAIWVYNRLPSGFLGGLSPNEVWSSCRSDHTELRRAHVFGCPVYVLDPKLANGDKIPKWNHRARMGMFVGFSHEHSSLVPLVLNLRTGHVSPQYHVIFDDKFETVPSLNPNCSEINDKFASLFENNRDFYLDQIDEDDDVSIPSLGSTWDDESTVSEGDSAASEGVSAVPEGVPTDSEGAHDHFNFDDPPPLSRQSRSTRNSSPAYAATVLLATTALPLAHALHTWADLPAGVMNEPSRKPSYMPTGRLTYRDLAEASVINSPWSNIASAFTAGYSGSGLLTPFLAPFLDGPKLPDPQMHRIQSLLEPDLSPLDTDDFLPASISPLVYSAKSSANSEDNPSYDEAMNGIYQHEYTEAARVELDTLQSDLDCWELVPRTDQMNVLPSTWAFKCKRYPDGRVKKFKARFCARGDRQKEGIDYFETWSPVVQWTTVRIMLILSCILRLRSVQADITAAFVHAELPANEEVFIHQPRGFYAPNTSSRSHVLRLKRALYGLKQAPRHFFNYLAKHLTNHGLKQSAFDPCLFIGSDIIVIVYVDDLLMYSLSDDPIDRLIGNLKADKIWIRKEDSAAGFLGVDMKVGDDGSVTLTQTGLIERIIDALGLDSQYSTKKDTPAEPTPLPKDPNGIPADPIVHYASIIGMLLYLAGHSRPDIAFAVHQCARYTFQPTKKHVDALKRIGRYLKGTRDKGIIMRPLPKLQVDCYPDADFAGLYNQEDAQDPHCVRSRTGYVILLAGCPVLWKSKLQTEIALSTMEAEYVALSQSCKDLFPLLDQIKELGNAVGLPVSEYTNLHTTIYEDNVGALTLGRLEPKRMTPRSKHYAIKYHWFREQIGPRNIRLVKIDTDNQLGDIFTKGLTHRPFSHLRSKLMGW